MDDIRGKLATLAGHSAVASGVDDRIRSQAAARDDSITARLDALRPSVLLEHGAADEYERLAEERGRLRALMARMDK